MRDFLSRLLSWAFGLFVSRTKAAGATEERAKINEQSAAQLERQTAVIKRPVTNDEVQKSLEDGTF